MSVYNQNRSRVITTIMIVVFAIITLQLLNLQIFSKQYKIAAANNAIIRNVVYPNRGIIYDKKQKALLENQIMYDLVVTPAEAKGIDTIAFCTLMSIDTAEYKLRLKKIANKNRSNYKPGVFEPLLTPDKVAKLTENMYRFPGFTLNERYIRSYPYNVGANILGYISEVDSSYLRKHKEDGYEIGDYAGKTGLEASYEKILMGTRGVRRLIRDKHSRSLGSFENGAYDTTPVAGKNLYTSIDVKLQQLGEKLMNNKVGSIVALNPKTGSVLCMVSAPTYNPNYLTGSDRRKHFNELFLDPRQMLQNRAVANAYSPGSTFKTVIGLVSLAEGVISTNTTISCAGAYWGCGNGKPGCLDKGTFNFTSAVAVSDNSYFANAYKKILDQSKFVNTDSALDHFNRYVYTFGLGQKLGIDLPTESRGNIPTSAFYRKMHGNKWFPCNIISNSIGQGEVTTTLLQLSNVMATIANKGWYYTPHVVDSIQGGDEEGVLSKYKTKNYTHKNVTADEYQAVQNGMQAVMEYGTGSALKIEGVTVCGKSGTVQNTLKGEKLKDHSFFGAFAPRENPEIAIAVMCENAGFGAATAGVIASLMVEQYLKDTIASADRQKKVEEMAGRKIIPSYMQEAMDKMNAAKQAALDSIKNLELENAEAVAEVIPTEDAGKNQKPLPNKKTTSAEAILKNEEEEH